MTIENKPELVNETIARVVNNAPVSELLRVYADTLRSHVESLSDEDLITSLRNAGYLDLIAKYAPSEADSAASDSDD